MTLSSSPAGGVVAPRRARAGGTTPGWAGGGGWPGGGGQGRVEMAALARAGAVAFTDDGHPIASSRVMRAALEYSRPLGLPILEHCEDLALSQGAQANEGPVSLRLGLKGYPSQAEEIMAGRG